MTDIHVEVFTEAGEWGWRCHSPGCGDEATGYDDCDDANAVADEHRREHRREATSTLEPRCHFCHMEHPSGTPCPGVADHWMSWS